MEPSQLGLVVGNMACRARANAWNHHRCRCRLFTVASCHSALRKAIAYGASCRLRRAALIWARGLVGRSERWSRLILPGSGGMGRHQSIDRVGADDVMSLVSDREDPPLRGGAMLVLDP